MRPRCDASIGGLEKTILYVFFTARPPLPALTTVLRNPDTVSDVAVSGFAAPAWQSAPQLRHTHRNELRLPRSFSTP